MAPHPTGRELSRPKLPQLLIALFLAKSRPSNLSVHEHVQSLRAVTKAGRRLEGSSTAHNHIDTSAFWRDAFKKSEETQNELRARVFELEQVLAARKEPASPTPITATTQQKRKRGATNVRDGDKTVAPKRPRVDGVEQTSQDNDGSLQFSADDVLKPLSDQKPSIFLHHFYILRQLMARKTPEFNALATTLRQVLFDISRIVSISGISNDAAPRKPARTQRRGSRESLSNTGQGLDRLIAITRIFPYLLQSLHYLGETTGGRGFQGRVIYSFIEVFRDLLQHIFALSATQGTKTMPIAAAQTTRKPATRAAKQAPPPPPAPSTPSPNKDILTLCNILLALKATLDASKRPDASILEGLLFLLLTRAGAALKIFVFEDSDPAEFLQVPSAPQPDHATDRHRAEAHAPYLIYLLDRLLPPPPTVSRRVSEISFPPPTPPPIKPPPRTPARPLLTAIPSSTLQSTLLRAVFGPESAPFADGLAPHCLPDASEDVLDDALFWDAGDVGEWFTSEVWRIVGWSAVAGCIAW